MTHFLGTLNVFWTIFDGNIDTLPPRPLNQSRVKYQVQEMNQYTQETCPGGGQGGPGGPGNLSEDRHKEELH